MTDAFPIPDTVAASDPRPPALSPDGKRLAILKPAHHKQSQETVKLMARTSRGLVTVETVPHADRDGVISKASVFSVASFRLVDAVTRRPLVRGDFADLPWKGGGPDPDLEERT